MSIFGQFIVIFSSSPSCPEKWGVENWVVGFFVRRIRLRCGGISGKKRARKHVWVFFGKEGSIYEVRTDWRVENRFSQQACAEKSYCFAKQQPGLPRQNFLTTWHQFSDQHCAYRKFWQGGQRQPTNLNILRTSDMYWRSPMWLPSSWAAGAVLTLTNTCSFGYEYFTRLLLIFLPGEMFEKVTRAADAVQQCLSYRLKLNAPLLFKE